VCDKHTQIKAIEAFDQIVQYGVVEVVNGGGELVVCDGEDQAIGHPCLVSGSIGGPLFLALGCGHSRWDDWKCRRFGNWDVKLGSITSKVDGWVLE
jgi:hypothetical protein